MLPVARTSQARRRCWRTVARAGLLLALLGTGACEDENLAPPVCPSAQVGALEGYVRAGGTGVVARVGLRGIEPSDFARFETWSDSTGWYHIDVPVRRYQVFLSLASGSGVPSAARDTVCVSSGTRRFDLLRGRATVRVATPAFFDGCHFQCNFNPVTARAGSFSASCVATNGHVEFDAPLIPPGVYCFGLELHNGGSCWLPDASDLRLAQQVVVGVERPIVYGTALEHAAAISGHIRGSWQQAHWTSPNVEARTHSGWSVGDVTPANDGSYLLGLLIAEPVQLVVEIDDFERWIGGDSPQTATVFAPQPGEVIQDVDLVESGILCQLTGPGFVTSVDARIQVRDETGRAVGMCKAWVNPFPISNLRPGRYFLFVSGYCEYEAERWASQWYDGADSLADATPVDLPAGALVPITVQLTEGGALEGRVLTAAGELAGQVAVAAFDRHGVSLCEGWRYFQDGTFSIPGLNNGDFTLGVQGSPDTWWYPGTASIDSATVIQVRDHATVRGLEWRLPPGAPEKARP